MLRIINKPIFLLKNVRRITTNTHANNNNPTSSRIETNDKNKFESNLHSTSLFDKKILVWTKKYAKVEDVPKLVPLDVMQTATSRLRIRIANFLLIGTVIIFLITIIQGQQKKKKKLAEMKIEQDNTRREIIANMRNEAK
ncbi:UPF0389 protein CG9231 [Chelonus insularis]|uniref:UPF0389 protein CG9231 n=1 Tax=Chelonus insularis TaxID=460826 RepID=UPI00158BD0FE|nr:UPF0389 protein CG9231 [Chelonus insularis]